MELSENVVFKKCIANDREYLVVAQKPIDINLVNNKPFQFLCNESRKNIGNKYFAKFRCNGLLILNIIDLDTSESIDSITHVSVLNYWFLPSRTVYTKYIKGMLIQPDEYDENTEAVCRPGLHYFLSQEAALNYNNGVSKGYDANGHKHTPYVPIIRREPLHNAAPVAMVSPSVSFVFYKRENNQRTGGQKMVLAPKLKKQKDVIQLFKKSRPIRCIQPKFQKVSRYVGCFHQ